MKTSKVSFDFSDRPDIIEGLRMLALKKATTQKEIITKALESFFSHEQENALLLSLADKTFSEWNDPENNIYDDL